MNPAEFYQHYKNNVGEVMRLALAGDGFVAFVTSLFAIDLDMSQRDRSHLLGQLRSNKMMEAYVNHKNLFPGLSSGKIKADFFEAYIGFNLLQDLKAKLFLDEILFIREYIDWAYPKIKQDIDTGDMIDLGMVPKFYPNYDTQELYHW